MRCGSRFCDAEYGVLSSVTLGEIEYGEHQSYDNLNFYYGYMIRSNDQGSNARMVLRRIFLGDVPQNDTDMSTSPVPVLKFTSAENVRIMKRALVVRKHLSLGVQCRSREAGEDADHMPIDENQLQSDWNQANDDGALTWEYA